MPDVKLPESIDAKTWFDEPPPPRTSEEEAADAARSRITVGQLVAEADEASLKPVELVWHDETKAGDNR